MIIKCISNTGKLLPFEITQKARGWTKEAMFPLTIGKEYKVYAVEIIYGYIWYYIEDNNYDGNSVKYPIHYPAFLFEIINGNFSKYWSLSFVSEGEISFVKQLISFMEWNNEDAYYDLLTDGQEREVAIYNRYKKFMDEELSQA